MLQKKLNGAGCCCRSSAGALREVTCKQTMGLKIEREKAALMHVNKKSATLMRATKASDKSRSILEVSDEKVSESKREE
jgi:hypothetical protein